MQKHELGASTFRGDKGYLSVSRGRSTNPLYDAFIEAGRQSGYPINEDFNGVSQDGIGRFDFAVRNGHRGRYEVKLFNWW
jgi:choline dehydrogenase